MFRGVANRCGLSEMEFNIQYPVSSTPSPMQATKRGASDFQEATTKVQRLHGA
jgi:hypothetical protein